MKCSVIIENKIKSLPLPCIVYDTECDNYWLLTNDSSNTGNLVWTRIQTANDNALGSSYVSVTHHKLISAENVAQTLELLQGRYRIVDAEITIKINN